MPTVSARRARASSPARFDTSSRTRGPEGRGAVHLAGVVGVRAGHERGLAHAQRLKRGADLPVQPQGAQPALGLVLRRVGERHGGAGERDDERGVLRKRDVARLGGHRKPPCFRA